MGILLCTKDVCRSEKGSGIVIWLFLICIVLLIAVIALGIKVYVMRKAAKEICAELSEKLKSDTNKIGRAHV